MTNETQLWHVTVTVGGIPQEMPQTHEALVRLHHQRPFIHSLRYAEDRAEVRYWEEAADMVDAASLALRMWTEHRISADLPDWQVVGLEVVDKDTYQRREVPAALNVAGVTPRQFRPAPDASARTGHAPDSLAPCRRSSRWLSTAS